MSPTPKSSHTREDEEERGGGGTPRAHERDPEERTIGSMLDEEGEPDKRALDEDELTEDIDLDAIPAMEGPDA